MQLEKASRGSLDVNTWRCFADISHQGTKKLPGKVDFVLVKTQFYREPIVTN